MKKKLRQIILLPGEALLRPEEGSAAEPGREEKRAELPGEERQNAGSDRRPSWEQVAEQLRKDLEESWGKPDYYYEYRFYVGQGNTTEDGRYRLLHTLVVEDYDSPAQESIETTDYHGAAVAEAETGRILYKYRYFYTHDAGIDVRYSTYEYKTILHSSADSLWLLTRGSDLSLRQVGSRQVATIAKGWFQYAAFLEDDRFVLAQRSDGSVVVFDLTDGLSLQEAFPGENDDPPASGKWNSATFVVSMKGGESVTYRFAGSDYRVVRRIDDNAFLIKHNDDDQICWLDWEYENSAGGSGL